MGISSEIQIYNLALNAVGERSNISLPTENSRQAEVCRLWYSPIVEQVLAAAPWAEATKYTYLAQQAETRRPSLVGRTKRTGAGGFLVAGHWGLLRHADSAIGAFTWSNRAGRLRRR